MEPEFARWRGRTAFRRREVGAMAVYHAKIGHADVDVVLTGMGLGSARRAMEAVMDSSYSVCISSGFAGGLWPSIRVVKQSAPLPESSFRVGYC